MINTNIWDKSVWGREVGGVVWDTGAWSIHGIVGYGKDVDFYFKYDREPLQVFEQKFGRIFVLKSDSACCVESKRLRMEMEQVSWPVIEVIQIRNDDDVD